MKTKVLGLVAICTIAATAALIGSANANSTTAPTPTLGTFTITVGGPEQIIDFINSGAVVEFSATGLTTSNNYYVDVSALNPAVGSYLFWYETPLGTPTFYGLLSTLPTSIPITAGGTNLNLWFQWEATCDVTCLDPFGGFELTTTAVTAPTPTPLPAALPLFATGLGALGLLGWRRKRKGAALAA